MNLKENKIPSFVDEPVRKLSLVRLFLALIMLLILSTGGYLAFLGWNESKPATFYNPWFGAYTDVTATPLYPFEQLGATSYHTLVLSFIVSSVTDPCTPTWGGVYNLNQASSQLDLDRRIARLRQQGGNIAVSFGGLLNNELALNCTDPDKLLSAYQQVVDRYDIETIDFDLEGSGLTNQAALKERARVVAKLQKSRRNQKKNLAIWLTLPVSPQGLNEYGTNAVSAMLSAGVDLAGVNIMTMDYSTSLPSGEGMEQASEDALKQTHYQLGILYHRAGISLRDATLWSKMGATIMIGQNDFANEVFNLNDAWAFNRFAQSVKLGRLSIWSSNRDIQCGDNYVNVKVVSDSCSGVKQEKLDFSKLLSQGFSGEIHEDASIITKEDLNTNIQVPDDPKTSPYQIWKKTGAYLAGTKVVWHHNVYQAKWWTQGNIPDDPVLQSWQTPWQLIGPVLPNETPIPQPTLPPGMYPEWNGKTAYQAGDRVVFNQTPYQAKWWTQGDSPAASSANPDSSPWVPLTLSQINDLLHESSASSNQSHK